MPTNLEDIYNSMGLEGLQKIIEANPVQFTTENSTGQAQLSPNRTVDLRTGRITQMGNPTPEPTTLTGLVNTAQRMRDPVHGIGWGGEPAVKQMAERFGREGGLNREQITLQRMVGLGAQDAAQREARDKLKAPGELPPELLSAVGKPGFSEWMNDLAAAGSFHPATLKTLREMDAKEHEQFAKENAPAKESAQTKKLKEIAGRGFPLTVDIVRKVYGLGKSEDKEEGAKPFSLAELAGLEQPAAGSEQGAEGIGQGAEPDRVARLRAILGF